MRVWMARGLKQRAIRPYSMKNLAICVSLKNRSNLIVKQEDPNTYNFIAKLLEPAPSITEPPRTLPNGDIELRLLPRMLASLKAIQRPEDQWHVIIVDFGSTDENIDELCRTTLEQIPYTIHKEPGTFNRGGGLDKGACIARDLGIDSVFFCDSDMIFTDHDIFDQAKEVLEANKIYYPICFSYTNSNHTRGFWRESGYGMVYMNTATYFQTPRWANNITWGWEDRALHDILDPTTLVRSRARGYFHQWHPNSSEFKTREYAVKQHMGPRSVLPRLDQAS